MSQPLLPGFRFATEAQWNSCLFIGADRQTAETRTGLRPFAPYKAPAQLFATHGAHAPAISEISDLLWRDDDGLLWRLPYGDAQPFNLPAPPAVGTAVRLVAAPGMLWAVSAAGLLQAFDVDSLSRLLTVDCAGQQVFDIAADGHGGLYALIGSSGARRIAHVDSAGNVTASFPLDTLPDASALVFLLRASRIVVLAKESSRLYWIDPATAAQVFSMPISTLRPCFDPTVIGSDGCTRLFVAGVDGQPTGGRSQVLIVEAGGDLLGTVAFDGKPTGLVADRTHLYVTTVAGLLRFEPAKAVPLGGSEVRAELITPALESPAETPQRWTRIEAEVELPAGCSIEISFASEADKNARDQIAGQLADRSVPPRQRLDYWRGEMAGSRTAFHGKEGKPGETATFAVPLHDVRDPYLWVQVALVASPGGEMPRLARLSVHYPGPTLIDNLPAIYRRGEFETANFLRGLVGVLETTTQQLDGRIGDLGRNIHPQTAPPEWLDFIARWRGLPWHDSLSVDQKRRIVGNGEALARGHGTRSGLALLLASLMPERPRRFRIVDLMADYGLVTLSGGSRLPALLAGLPKTATELGNKAILGMARLPCEEPESETARLLGRIRIDLAVDAAEQRDWSPWLGGLLDSMLPATARVSLRWLGRTALANSNELSDGLSLDDDPLARLGTDAVTGLARLAGRDRTALPGQISRNSSLK